MLLSIIEQGGYPDFTPLYKKAGFEVVNIDSVRKAVKLIRKHKPEVIVAEFNFQSDFRDRTSSLETVMSSTQGITDTSLIVFYEKEYTQQYQRFLQQFDVFASIEFPVQEVVLESAIRATML